MKINVIDNKGKESAKSIELNDAIWALPFKADLVAQVVNVYLSNFRSASKNAKGRGDVSGGGKKPWKQKGTGRARSGSSRSPVWVGGGVTFAPLYRNWTRSVNKKMRELALKVMLSRKLKDGVLKFADMDSKFDRGLIDGRRVALVVTDNKEVYLRLRNINKVEVVDSMTLNALNLTRASAVFFDSNSLDKLEQRLTDGK